MLENLHNSIRKEKVCFRQEVKKKFIGDNMIAYEKILRNINRNY